MKGDDDMKRIEELRKQALSRKISYDKFYLHFYEKLLEYKNTNLVDGYSDAYKAAFEKIEPIIGENELIVGKPGVYDEEISEKMRAVKEKGIDDIIAFVGQDSHMAVDFELLLDKGVAGIKEQIENKLSCEKDEDKQKYYSCCIDCLNVILDFSMRYSRLAKELAAVESNPQRKSELETIANVCQNVPQNPATSFYEAIQSINFIAFTLSYDPCRCVYQQFMMGRPDQYLYKYYKHDIENNVITKEFAQTLINCMCIQINNRVPNGLSCGYMLGGRRADGSVVANELTEMFMQAIDDVRLVYPAVGLCYTFDMPGKYLDKACKILSHGRSHPAIFNDDLITSGLEQYGVPHNEAVRYTHSTCVEITPETSSNIWVASPYTNMAQLLLDVLKTEPDSFEALLNRYFDALDERIKTNADEQNEFRRQREKKTIMPLLSCFVNDCIEKGLDINKGGARYNWIMPSFVGVANAVDSLYAVKELVYTEKALSIQELSSILENDFEGNEQLRLKCLNGYPKYGNDNDEIDSLVISITEHIQNTCSKHKTHFDSKLIPSVFCWIMHDAFGRQTGATPDGRRAGFPLGDGSGPCQGRERKGPTASILSSTKWSHKEFIGGVAVNMKFSKKMFDENSLDNMKNLIKTYIKRGGFEIQLNVVDKETLLKAQANPEEYSDLVVRIGGYSDYFVKLSSTMQEEVLLRTEHGI